MPLPAGAVARQRSFLPRATYPDTATVVRRVKTGEDDRGNSITEDQAIAQVRLKVRPLNAAETRIAGQQNWLASLTADLPYAVNLLPGDRLVSRGRSFAVVGMVKGLGDAVAQAACLAEVLPAAVAAQASVAASALPAAPAMGVQAAGGLLDFVP